MEGKAVVNKLLCVAALGTLTKPVANETDQLARQRTRLIAEIVATNDIFTAAEQRGMSKKEQQAAGILWERLWKTVRAALEESGVKFDGASEVHQSPDRI